MWIERAVERLVVHADYFSFVRLGLVQLNAAVDYLVADPVLGEDAFDPVGVRPTRLTLDQFIDLPPLQVAVDLCAHPVLALKPIAFAWDDAEVLTEHLVRILLIGPPFEQIQQ